MDVATLLIILTTVVGPAIGWLTAQYFNGKNVQLNFNQEVRDSYDSLLAAYKGEIERLRRDLKDLKKIMQDNETRHRERERELVGKINQLKKQIEKL